MQKTRNARNKPHSRDVTVGMATVCYHRGQRLWVLPGVVANGCGGYEPRLVSENGARAFAAKLDKLMQKAA